MLEMLLSHLAKVVVKCDKNLMTVANLGVCFGPTLLRPEEETVAAIMDIKFANVVVEILIQNWQSLLKTKPDSNPPPKPSHSKTVSPVKTSPTVKPPPYIPPPPPAHSSPPTLVQTVIFEGPKVVQASTVQQTSPPSNGPGYATWERTLRGGPPPTQPSTRSSVSSSLSNLSSMSTISSTPTASVPWYRAGPPLRPSPRQPSASQLVSQPSQATTARDDSSNTARSSRVSSTSSTDSLASWSSKETGGQSVASFNTGPSKGVTGMQPVELRKVRTLYACVGEHETELSFEPNQIITNVRPSLEPGWLEGILDGRVGLVPENYVEFLT